MRQALLLLVCGAIGASVGGNKAPDGTEVHCDLPGDLHRRNTRRAARATACEHDEKTTDFRGVEAELGGDPIGTHPCYFIPRIRSNAIAAWGRTVVSLSFVASSGTG
jgi:hypothetical protein